MSARLVIAVLTLAVAVSAAAAQTLPYPVKMAAAAEKPDKDGYRAVRVTLVIEKGHHIYANPVGLDDLVVAQTTLKIAAQKPLADVKLAYPKGEVVKAHGIGEFSVYRGTVVLQARVKQADGDTGPLEIRAFVSPTNAKQNYLWKLLKQVVP